MRARSSVLLTATLVVVATATLVTAGPASATASTYHDDFNGDGYRDLAVADPSATVSGKSAAGAVVVFYGSADGVKAGDRQVITQASTGIPGAPESGDMFADTLAAADLDGDGYADLLVGAEREDIGTEKDAGLVTVVWGGASGLGSGVTLDPGDLPDSGCGFGLAVAAGDGDGDGAADVTVGSFCGATHFRGPFTRVGDAADRAQDGLLGTTRGVLFGNVDGDAALERIMLPGRYGDDPGGMVYIDDWQQGEYVRTELGGADGTTGATGDVDGDGYGDLVLGDTDTPTAEKPGGHVGGEVSVWYGGPAGIDPGQRPTRLHQDSAGVPGAGEDGDEFGAALSAGDINGDGHADIAVGVPGEALSGRDLAGAVTVLWGSANGLTGSGARSYHQDSEGVSGAAENADAWGTAVHLADHNRDAGADLTVGVPGENGWGCTWNARGAAAGITVSGAFHICADKLNLTGGHRGLGSAIAG